MAQKTVTIIARVLRRWRAHQRELQWRLDGAVDLTVSGEPSVWVRNEQQRHHQDIGSLTAARTTSR
jgi:hypothetical protein